MHFPASLASACLGTTRSVATRVLQKHPKPRAAPSSILGAAVFIEGFQIFHGEPAADRPLAAGFPGAVGCALRRPVPVKLGEGHALWPRVLEAVGGDVCHPDGNMHTTSTTLAETSAARTAGVGQHGRGQAVQQRL